MRSKAYKRRFGQPSYLLSSASGRISLRTSGYINSIDVYPYNVSIDPVEWELVEQRDFSDNLNIFTSKVIKFQMEISQAIKLNLPKGFVSLRNLDAQRTFMIVTCSLCLVIRNYGDVYSLDIFPKDFASSKGLWEVCPANDFFSLLDKCMARLLSICSCVFPNERVGMGLKRLLTDA